MRTVLLCLTSLTTSLSAQVQPAPDLVGEQLGVVLTTRLRATGELVRLEACAPSVVRALSTALRARLSAPGAGSRLFVCRVAARKVEDRCLVVETTECFESTAFAALERRLLFSSLRGV